MKERDSNIELLRVAALGGIVIMHCYGPFLQAPTAVNLLCGQLSCSLFNTGVTLFMLIAGYYGMKFSLRKAAALWLTVLFYSLLSCGINRLTGGTADWVRALHPVTAGTYWFMTAYLLILAGSPLLNRAAAKTGFKLGTAVLALLFLCLYVVPFVLGGHLLHDGKNPANMAVVYLTGRWIRLYLPPVLPRKVTAWAAVFCLGAIFGGDYLLSLYLHRTMLPLSADNSPFILAAAVAVFLWVRSYRFVSPRLNFCASHVLAIYLLEGALRGWCFRLFPLHAWAAHAYFPAVMLLMAVSISALCMGVDVLRSAFCRAALALWQRLHTAFSA